MIDPDDCVDGEGGALIDLAIPSDEKDRIDQLLNRYDALLVQAEDLSAQIENLLREWNPAAPGLIPPPSDDRPMQ